MSQIKFRFNFPKALQATAWLLRLAGGRMRYIKLLKLLYIAEREYLAEEARMIFGDRVVAMKYGPVLTNVYDLIKSEGDYAETWREYIHKTSDYNVILRSDPGYGDLCRAETEKLTDVFERYGKMDGFRLSEVTHQFPEWLRNYEDIAFSGSFPISVEDILCAQGKRELIGRVIDHLEEVAWSEKLFGVQS